MDPLTWLLIGALGAWAALDGAAVGQFMVSRPLVMATLTGAVLGEPTVGFLLGFFLEVAHLAAVPSGGTRLPEPGPAAIPAAVTAVLMGGGAGMALGLALGMVLAIVGGAGVVLQRRINGRLIAGLETGNVSVGGIARRISLALALDATRGGLIAVGGTVIAVWLATGIEARWPLADETTWALLLALLAYPAGVLGRELGPYRARAMCLLGGGAIGLAFGFWGGLW